MTISIAASRLRCKERVRQRVAACCSLFAGVAVATDPITIGNWSELQGMVDDLDGDYVLVADLNESSEGYGDVVDTAEGFTPIGWSHNPFTGTFDGNGYTISNIAIEDDSYVGVFSATDETVELTDVCLVAVNISGRMFVGGVVGANNGTISDSSVTGSIDSSGSHVGGLVGSN